MAFAVVDTVLSGHASAVDLATMGLGMSVYSTVFVGLMGATSALNPIVAQHFGGGRLAAIGVTYVPAVVVLRRHPRPRDRRRRALPARAGAKAMYDYQRCVQPLDRDEFQACGDRRMCRGSYRRERQTV